ncbi:MAG: DNA-binding domain-containing protein [Tistlia sp.]|uniref:HvfC/BufC family peptide modification chaperone n=1 Tax=Tistlia sp. TaxID=3057121 RepID=UPI0034A43AD9
MPADATTLEGLVALQRSLVRAVHGDPAAFAASAALLGGEGAAAAGIPATKRLFLHLNTIDHALLGVLRQAYPATARLLGPERFATRARAFLRAHPPRRPQLSGYGAGFERFLAEAEEPAELAGVAALDWAAQEAYLAADWPALGAAGLAAVPQERHARLLLAPVPSARLLALPAGAWARWAEAIESSTVVLVVPGGAARAPTSGALVWRRPDLSVAARPLSEDERLCLAALAEGRPLLEAAAQGADFDLAALLTDALAGGLFRGRPPGGS